MILARLRSARQRSTKLRSTKLRPTRLRSTRIGSTRIGSTKFRSARFGSARLRQNRNFMSFTRKTLKYAAIGQIIVIALVISGLVGRRLIDNAIRPPELPIAPVAPAFTSILNDTSAVQPNTAQAGDSGPGGEPIAPMIAMPEERRPDFFTFLVFGLTEGLNANTIMVAAYDASAGKGYIISIPRDTQVDVQRNSRKIVSAYNVGRLNGGEHEGGVNRLKYEVQTLIGFRPDFYVSIDYEAFIRAVDAIGGVEVDVPFHMRYDDPCQDLHIDIPAGLQILDGQDALRFARYRRGNDPRQTISDYQRIEHQQQVIASVFQSLLTPRTILRIPEFIGIFNNYVNSDLAYGELLWFVNQGRVVITGDSSDALTFYTIPMLGTSGAPHWYELADRDGILELINRTVNPLMRDITRDDLRIVS